MGNPITFTVWLSRQKPSQDLLAQVLVVFAGLVRATTSQSSRQNVLDVDANAVPAQRARRVDRGDGQLDQADDRQDGDGEPSVSARGPAQQQLRDAATIVHSGCVSRSALVRVCFLAISTSAKGIFVFSFLFSPSGSGSHPPP
jgi:hypothetical protein